MNTARKRRGGFTLVELMWGVLLFSGFSVMAISLATRSVSSLHTSQAVSEKQLQLDRAIERLRQDVWMAVSVQSTDPHQLALKQNDGQTIAWTFGASLTRQLQNDHPVRTGLGDATVHVEGALVTLDFAATRGAAASQQTFGSAALMEAK